MNTKKSTDPATIQLKQIEYRTKRLTLRPLQKTDYTVWLDAHINGLPMQNKWDHEPLSKKQCSKKSFNQELKRLETLAKTDDYYRYYIFVNKTGLLIGLIDFDIYKRGSHQFANFGYQIYNRHWGQGYGTEASRAGLKIGFRYLHLNRLEAAINLDNKISAKLAKRIGMKREGIKRRYWYEYGKWTDHVIYVANPEDVGLKAKKPFEFSK